MIVLLLLACHGPDPIPDDPTRTTDPTDTDSTGTNPTNPTDTTTNPAWDDAWTELLARAQTQVSRDQVPGIELSVVLGGHLRYAGGVGVTEWSGSEPVTADTVFRWASVTKMHTATAVLQLAEEGSVDLDAPITDYVPDASVASGYDAATITPRHLLTHTAALEDALDWECPSRDTIQNHSTTWDPYLWAPPGSFYNYSNTGFVWLGALIEVMDGGTYEDSMQTRVLDPAGMTTATFDVDVAVSGPHATGTTWWNDDAFLYPLDEYDCPWSRPAAWLHGTTTDLARTVEWQLAGGGALLSEESTLAMRAQVDTHYWPDSADMVGMGFFTYPYKERPLVMHDGWVTGFVSTVGMLPEDGFGVTVVANADWADPYALMYDAMDLFLDLPDSDWPEFSTDPSTWTVFEGSYDDPHAFGRIELTLVGDQLTGEFVDYGFTAVLLQDSDEYFWFQDPDSRDWYDVRFIPDTDGVYRWMVNRYGVAERVDGGAARSGVAAATRPLPALPRGKAAPDRWRSR